MIKKTAAVTVPTILAVAASLIGASPSLAADVSRAPLGPCNSPQAVKFTFTGANGGTSTIQNCFSTSKRVAMRIHNVVFPVSWDQTGACVTLRAGAKTSMRNSTGSYGFSWVSC